MPRSFRFFSSSLEKFVMVLDRLNKRGDGRCFPSRKTELGNLAHLRLDLAPDLVRHPPPQLDGFYLLALVPRVPHLDGLRHTAALLRLQRPPRLWLELGLVALEWGWVG